MTRKPDVRTACKAATDVLARLNVTEAPIDPKSIAEQLDILVRTSAKLGSAFSGCLMREGETFGILYSLNIPSQGFQRFTIAHELGHYSLVHQHSTIFGETGQHHSQSNFASYDWFEVEADHFAAELLMPEVIFRQALRQAGLGLPAVKSLSSTFITSLTSTAIRYAQFSYDPTAVIVSEGQRVNYCFPSESLQRLRGVSWGLRKGDPLPPNSETARFNRDIKRVRQGEMREGTSHIAEWFTECNKDFRLNEDVIGLGAYGKTLTIVFTRVLLDEDDPY